MPFFSEEIGIDKIKPGLPLKIEISSTPEFSGGEFKSTIADVEGDIIKAGMASLKGRFIPLPVGMIARLLVTDQSSIYVLYATVIENTEENKMPITIFKIRSKIRRIQRRRFIRIEFVTKGTLKVAGTEEIFDFMTKDISAGGSRILTPARIETGQIIYLNLKLDEELKFENIQSQIVRSIESESSELREYGIMFLNLPASVEDKITRFVFKLELKLKGGKTD